MSDHWSHHDPAVRELIRKARVDALNDAADWIESTDSQKGIASRALSPGKAFSVAVLRDRAGATTIPGPVSETGPAHTTGGQP